MQNKQLWISILLIQVLYVFQVKGQQHQEDSISVPCLMQDKMNLRLQLAQPSLQFVKPELSTGGESLQGTNIDRNAPSINFYRELKYLKNITGDSSTLLLPVYPGLGDYLNFGGILGSFNITNSLALDYGAFISAQYGFLYSTKQIVLGTNFFLHYAITNKLQIQTWGQYVTPGNSPDPTFNMRTFFPTTNFGSGLLYNSSHKTKIKVGIEYQYDQSDKIWKPESGGKVLLKF